MSPHSADAQHALQLAGGCHCGNIAFTLLIDPAPGEIPARVCSCSFCTKHGGVWTAMPDSRLTVTVQDARLVNEYAFETKTARFHVCRRCGVVPLVTCAIDGRDYAVVNVNTLHDVPASLLNHSPASFDGEGEGARLTRRARHWIADVRYQHSAA